MSDIPRVTVPRANTDIEDAALQVFEYWRTRYERVTGANSGPRKQPIEKRMKKVRARLKDGYAVKQLCEAIDGCFSKSFNVENGHLDLELICRDDAHVSQYRITVKKNGNQPDNVLDQSRAEILALENAGACSE